MSSLIKGNLLRDKRLPFTHQKMTFYSVKGDVLLRDSYTSVFQ
ncbi:hypothetical protein HMPREF3218_0200276 [Prevotella bivia]|uniref:Uncharacterized protein n=2 Tax=Prevotella bivia TaxID=28125 RepID=I4Z8M8_9BACT|nr:hypothetical protein PrebiDRAFT_0832 [Prevotella bivia DSM 20514]KXU59869.1 hypothetical protein HMPREF3218_0200276 [Prevotella bivia]